MREGGEEGEGWDRKGRWGREMGKGEVRMYT